MKALVLTEKECLELQNLPDVALKNHEIKVKVGYVGICGTDKHLYKGLPGSGDANMPVVLGHEISGVVADLGLEVHSTLRVGDRMALIRIFLAVSVTIVMKAARSFVNTIKQSA
ncbi:alcohol dehydrogenase catalytic domain-containing protein [Sporolactobacillus shoreicorticis]|uniref:Alcohol dehydrogenase catalytic domain-containing protein n=1 Tax=Sporolactobacillus shoreicorticis TaxID=1923877 RepID=A0ABW5RYR0_9BACL|nr:alcohol dehydrogenase catalytic domain-containing protein [Sporolactobacillus shoreicorticis]MCO7127918.1 alcohol dehydrogenase catalytic domain-containing protein [Sporolactobacillus shoreicorticis]